MARKVEASLQFAKMPRGRTRAAAKLRGRQFAAQRVEDIRVIAQTAPPGEDFAWGDRHGAPNKLSVADPGPASFDYGDGWLVVTSVVAAA